MARVLESPTLFVECVRLCVSLFHFVLKGLGRVLLCQVGNKLKAINDLTTSSSTALDAKR